ncbi:unnamed protein product [Brassica oleracea]
MLETDVLCSVSPLEAVMCFQASYGDLSSGGKLIRYLRRVNQIFPLFRETTLPPREASLSDYSILSPQLFRLLVALVPEYNTSSSSTSNHYLRLSSFVPSGVIHVVRYGVNAVLVPWCDTVLVP